MVKKCPRCKQYKELCPSNFRTDPKTGDYVTYCRPCEAAYTREYREKKKIEHIELLFKRITRHLSEEETDYILKRLKKLWSNEHEK